MFEARLKTDIGYMIYTVYAVDFNHDAFLIAKGSRFKWVPMDKFIPL